MVLSPDFIITKLDNGTSLGNANPSNKKGTWRMPSALKATKKRPEEAEKVWKGGNWKVKTAPLHE